MLNFQAWNIPYESMHHNYLKKDKKIFNSLWNVTTNPFFFPSKTQYSLSISKRKNLPLHIGMYKNKLACLLPKRQLLKSMYKTFMLLPDCFPLSRITYIKYRRNVRKPQISLGKYLPSIPSLLQLLPRYKMPPPNK